MNAQLRIFGRHLQIVKLPQPQTRFYRGGQATPWPWWSFQIGRIELAVSRVRPKGRRP